MRSCSICISLIAFCLRSITVSNAGDIFMIRQKPVEENDFYRLTCVTEDHHAAIVWNHDLRNPYKPPLLAFSTPWPPHYHQCAYVTSNGCIATWQPSYSWRVVHSTKRPMGPVFDSRWEGFQECRFSSEYLCKSKMTLSGVVVFSVRGLMDIRVELCETGERSEETCFGIVIPASPNRTSSKHRRYREETGAETLRPNGCDTEEPAVRQSRCIIDASEWQTFTLTWNEDRGEMRVYGEGGFPMREKVDEFRHVSYLFFRSSGAGLIRFHSYNYFLTHKSHTELYSAYFLPPKKNFCIELLVSLCKGCALEIDVVDYFGKSYKIGRILGDGEFAYGELPTWRVAKLNASLTGFTRAYVQVKILTIPNQRGQQGRWAIDSIRECAGEGAVRMSTITALRSSAAASPFSSIIGCQQLSYSHSAMVKSDGSLTYSHSSSQQKCNRGWMGPSYNCTDSCVGTSVCDASSCICSVGFEDSDCDTKCTDGRYGYKWQGICSDSCETRTCDTVTELCKTKCKNHFLPPSCRTELKAPVVFRINATVILLEYPSLVAEGIRNISFLFKPQNKPWKTVSPNLGESSTKSAHQVLVQGLLQWTSYRVKAVVTTAQGIRVESPGVTYTVPAHCQAPSAPSNLAMTTSGNGSFMLKWNHPPSSPGPKFAITAEVLDTRLRNNHFPNPWTSNIPHRPLSAYIQVDHPCSPVFGCEYATRAYLPTATEIRLYVGTENECGAQSWAHVDYKVPASLGFTDELKVFRKGAYVILKLPPVINDTRNTSITVVVKGSPTCTSPTVPPDLRILANMTAAEEGWIAAEFQHPESRPEQLTIGKDNGDENSGNCPLRSEKAYILVVIAIDEVDKVSAGISSPPMHPTPEKRENSNFNSDWIAAVLWILLICILIYFIWRRKFWDAMKRLRLENVTSCSESLVSFVKSKTTCTPQQPQHSPAEAELSGILSASDIVVWKRYSHLINIEDLDDYVKDSIASMVLESQFVMLPKGRQRQCKYGLLPENKPKNRYANIIAYDSTRVILKKIPGDPYSDYINANYVQGFRKKKAYIATQGPIPQTVVDFWRMVWQEETPAICMLANIVEGQKTKCEQYWPEFGASQTYGDIVVVTEGQEVFADFTFRTFQVSCKEESRKIEHLHYTGWPDHTVPMYINSVITYLEKLKTTSVEQGPIIVHCSAGVGRTGTIILCDICLQQATAKGTVDVLAEFKKLRDCRVNMVDNNQQYLFVHLVLVEYLLSPRTKLAVDDNFTQVIQKLKKKLPQHIERLRNTTWQDQALYHLEISPSPPVPDQLAKNRFPVLAPVSSSLVYLDRFPKHDNSSDYVSAVIVDGPRLKKQYLASQLPLPSTFSDLWRLIAQHKVELVVILQRPDTQDPTCCDIIPEGESFDPVPFINVESKTKADPEKSPMIDELLLTETSGVKSRTQQVTVLTCPEWGLGNSGKPPPPRKLVELWIASKNIHRQKGPTLVLCHDGITGCGLYLALSFLLERMAVEQECDIILAVRAIRRSRLEFVQSQEQFEYLYDAAAEFAVASRTYANLAEVTLNV